ncbi:alpha/beta fold hydrolase [Aeromicrobium sp. Leaf350]|uniref:alpha/beta fold hydrolase n=1 Tax=Aeromicrobium sp. Leaf350 TaxID=2876565 RepID=UPI001E292E5F|nr:alpha/beta fold hydrolase [Aeromicrobium sp. Leaf350]
MTGPVPVRRGYVDVAHGQVHVRTAGTHAEPPTLLCLHMSPASGLVYENVMAEIGRTRRVVAPDTPGFGASDPTPQPPEISDYADVMAEVVRAEQERTGDARPVDVMGYHTGSFTAIELALRHPGLVRRIVTVSMPLFTAEELAHFLAIYRTDPIFTEDGENLLAKWRWFVEFFGVGRFNTVEDAARIFLARLSGGPRHWWGHHAAFRYDIADALSRVDVPITVLNLDDDLTHQTRRAAEHLPAGAVVERPDWTHGFLDNDAAGAAAVVVDLLDREDG